MRFMIYLAFATVALGFVLSDNHTHLDNATETTEAFFTETEAFFTENDEAVTSPGIKYDIDYKLKTVTDGIFGAHEEDSTEFLGIDAAGCDWGVRKQFESKCDFEYDRVNEEAHTIEDQDEKTETLCCSLEDYEKCSLRAYDRANCVADKTAIRENLKAARLFLSIVANVSCSRFRGQCAYYSTASTVQANSYIMQGLVFIISILISLSKWL